MDKPITLNSTIAEAEKAIAKEATREHNRKSNARASKKRNQKRSTADRIGEFYFFGQRVDPRFANTKEREGLRALVKIYTESRAFREAIDGLLSGAKGACEEFCTEEAIGIEASKMIRGMVRDRG